MNKNKVRKIAVIIGILIIPLMYSFFYLKAFWDPYQTLSDVKVAVVNNDKGYNINGKDRNLGDELAKSLENTNDLDFDITSSKDAKDGLYGTKYYATLTIPKDFSKSISKFGNADIPKLTYSPNEKKNYLAAQILNTAISKIEKQTTEKLTKEVVGNIKDEIKSVPISLGKIEEGLNSLTNGSIKINNGVNSLYNGTKTLNNGYSKFNNGINLLTNGVNEYTKNIDTLNKKTSEFKKGTEKLKNSTSNLSNLSEKSSELSTKIEELNNGVSTYTSSVNNYINTSVSATDNLNTLNFSKIVDGEKTEYVLSSEDYSKYITQLKTLNYLKLNSNTLISKGNELANGVNKFKNNSSLLLGQLAGLSDLQGAIILLDQNTSKLNDGVSILNQNGKILANSSNTLNNSSNTINSGITSVNEGVKTLSNGTEELVNGNITATNEVAEGKKESEGKICKLENIDKFASKPIEVKKKSVEPVSNYGTSFSPYFMSLSLWIGAIIIFFGIYFDTESTFKILSRDSNKPKVRALMYYALGILQALVLGFIIRYILGLEVNHLGYYYLSVILVSLVFVSIVQFCIIHLKDIGKFLTIFLLILQLTSCGGTFPMETVPKFFNILYPYMPMTYSVKLFKETISGVENLSIGTDITILICIFVVMAVITIFFDLIKNLFKKTGN